MSPSIFARVYFLGSPAFFCNHIVALTTHKEGSHGSMVALVLLMKHMLLCLDAHIHNGNNTKFPKNAIQQEHTAWQ
jgi:hypothetical protein